MSIEFKMDVKDFIDYVKNTKSKNTVKLYRRGIRMFSEWYGKSPNEILEERRKDSLSGNLHQKKRFTREIEKFHKSLLEKGYKLNSATSLTSGIIQLFRFFEMPVTIPTGSDVSKVVVTTKDYVPTPEEYRKMFNVADSLRDKLIISMGKDLGWRISDFLNQRKDQLPNLESQPPIAYSLLTEKENVVAKSFLSAETVELLKQYLPTLPEHNPYLFPTGKGKKPKPFDSESVNRILRQLAKKAGIVIPKRKWLRFHSFRKRFLTTCANLSIDVNIAKILVGKNVSTDMLTYLSEVEHRKAFLKVQDVLRLTDLPTTTATKPTSQLEREVEDLKRLVYGMYALGYGEAVKEAEKATGIKLNSHLKKTVSERPKRKYTIDEIMKLGDQYLKRNHEEYNRLIEENNNNNH